MDCEENRLMLLHQKLALPLPLHAQRGSDETVSSALIPCGMVHLRRSGTETPPLIDLAERATSGTSRIG
jgi:hypothetical protein